MVAKVIKFKLLNHLFYYTETVGGSTSSTVTGDYLGDLALTYGFSRLLRPQSSYYRHLKKPEYEEINDFGFYCTVGTPIHRNQRTESYIQNTLFNVDGYVDMKAIENSGKSPFKNYRRVQGIRLNGIYYAVFISNKEIKLPPVIRVGKSLETLLLVEEVTKNDEIPSEFWLNAFTLKTVFGNLDHLVEILIENNKVNFSMVLENYNLVKRITQEEINILFQNII